jgi:hypothetical protein
VSVIKLFGATALALRADVEPGDHCRLLIAGPVELKETSARLTPMGLRIVYWSEPNPTCPTCHNPV